MHSTHRSLLPIALSLPLSRGSLACLHIAFGVDMGIFRRQLSQILLMAFPAMAVASIITGALIYAEFESLGWSFWPCWLIGVISSATDPVAVVALLKDLGAPTALGTCPHSV